MKISQNRIKLYCIVLGTIFLCWLLNIYTPAHGQALNDYEQQLTQISTTSTGTNITNIINVIFSAVRFYWLMLGIVILFTVMWSSVSGQTSAIVQLGMKFLVKSFIAVTIINLAYALVEPIIAQGI